MNKPVAWMHKEATAWLSCTNQHPETEIDDWIPLYTHPVKELTDEEIFEVSAKFPFIESGYERYEFAKAILRKTQEK